jgi:hypothetical protein
MANEYNTLMFVGGAWMTNISHVGPWPRLQYVRRFPDEYKGHMAVPPSHARSTWPLYSLTDEHKDFFKKKFLFCLPPRLESLQNRYKQTDIQYITIQQVKHHKYPIRQTLQVSNTTATHQYPNITRHRMHRSSLRWVIMLHPSTACVEHHLGELFSCRGVTL